LVLFELHFNPPEDILLHKLQVLRLHLHLSFSQLRGSSSQDLGNVKEPVVEFNQETLKQNPQFSLLWRVHRLGYQ